MKKYNYRGNSRPFAAVLCHSRNKDTAIPLLDELSKSGLRLCILDETSRPGKVLDKACSVIALLTADFYADEKLMEHFIRAGALKKELVCLLADASPMPELLQGYLYSINFISLSEYDTPSAARHILSSQQLKEPKVTKAQKRGFKTAIAFMVSAALIAAAGAVYALSPRKEEPAEPTVQQADISALEKYGIHQEDLNSIHGIVVLGDQLIPCDANKTIWDFCSSSWEDDANVWYRLEDGSRVETGGPEDLSFLTLLPNLQRLVLLNQVNNTLPDLSSLMRLSDVEIWDCSYDSVEGLSNCSVMGFLHLSLDGLTDISPLSTCKTLRQLDMTECGSLTTLDGLAAPKLREIQLNLENLTDISALSAMPITDVEINTRRLSDISSLGECKELKTVRIGAYGGCELSDLSALGNCPELKELNIDIERGTDVSFVSGLEKLELLNIRCRTLRNADAAADCTGLKELYLRTENEQDIDLSFLGKMGGLNKISLDNINGSLDFLRELEQSSSGTLKELSVGARDMDWAGLSAMTQAYNLHFHLRRGDGTALLEALQNISITHLKIESCAILPVDKLPVHSVNVGLKDCAVNGLDGFPCTGCRELILENCPAIRSLDGLESAETLEKLSIFNCPRLNDYSAVYGRKLRELDLKAQYALPDLGELDFYRMGIISLENIPEMTDLSCLDALGNEQAAEKLIKVKVLSDEFINMNALLRFKGSGLTVSPLMEEQAADLVDRGCFTAYNIEYPEGGWEMDGDDITLLSLEELDTLPKSMLRRISSLTLAADTVYEEGWGCEIRSEGSKTLAYIKNWQTGKEEKLTGQGSMRDFSKLSELTGLRELRLYAQKMDSLDGIQNLVNLTDLEIKACDIGDVSALFALDSLETLELGGTNPISLQGIQNLTELRRLSLQCAVVTDLSPLKEMVFSPRAQEEGFDLCLPHIWAVKDYPTDYSALSAAPWYSNLSMNSLTNIKGGVEWVCYLAGKNVDNADLFGCFRSNEELSEFALTVGRVSELHLGYNKEITDLTCLVNIQGLEKVYVCGNEMKKAVQSLDGLEYSFELIIEE